MTLDSRGVLIVIAMIATMLAAAFGFWLAGW